MLMVNLEKNFDKMIKHGGDDDPECGVTSNFVLYSAAKAKNSRLTQIAHEIYVYAGYGKVEAIISNRKDHLSVTRRARSHACHCVATIIKNLLLLFC